MKLDGTVLLQQIMQLKLRDYDGPSQFWTAVKRIGAQMKKIDMTIDDIMCFVLVEELPDTHGWASFRTMMTAQENGTMRDPTAIALRIESHWTMLK